MSTTTKTTNEVVLPKETPDVCTTCHSPHFWRSAYGGGLRCAVCDPWPSLAMVGGRWTIATRADGSRMWVPCLRRGERAKAIDEPTDGSIDEGIRWQNLDDEDGCWLVIWRMRK